MFYLIFLVIGVVIGKIVAKFVRPKHAILVSIFVPIIFSVAAYLLFCNSVICGSFRL